MSENRRFDDNSDSRITKEYLREILELNLKPVNEMLAVHNRTLFGNGSSDNQGLRVDVDRLKQRNIIINWILVVMGAPVFTYIGKKVIEFFRS